MVYDVVDMDNNHREEVLGYVKEFLEKGKLMQLATVSEGQPWIINCWYTFDDDLNLYFISGAKSRHVQELMKNPKVAGTITPHFVLDKLGQKIQGLSFEGMAEEVSGLGLMDVFNNFTAKWELAKEHISLENLKKGVGSKLYKIKVTKIVWFDEVNFPDDERQEIDL